MRERRSAAPLSALDRAIALVSPAWALSRARSRIALSAVSGYLGGRRDRTQTLGWSTWGASPDAEVLRDLPVLRARARDLSRNDPIARSAISKRVVNVIGTGSVCRPEIDAARLGLSPQAKRDWEAEALAIWSAWSQARDCDATRTQTFAELEDLVYRSSLESGDAFVVFRFRAAAPVLGVCLQVIEADRVSNPQRLADTATLAGGIERDRLGAPVAYHIADRHDLELHAGAVTWRRVPAYDRFGRALVLHIHGPRWRPDMTRYAPMLAPVIESLKQRSRYSEAELMAAVISACFAVGMKSDDGTLSTGLPVAQAASGGDGAIRFGDPGTVIDLLPGEEIQGFQLGRPNPGFAAFADAISAEIGAGLDMPKEVLLGLFQASYSASRAALEMAWQVFRVERARHVSQFCQPVYADVIAEAIGRGMLDAPGFFEDPLVRRAWLGATWMGPARPTIDPTKEASADEAYLNMGATTLTRITAERFGMDWETVAARRAEEIAMAPGTAAAAGAAPTDDPGGTDSDMGQS